MPGPANYQPEGDAKSSLGGKRIVGARVHDPMSSCFSSMTLRFGPGAEPLQVCAFMSVQEFSTIIFSNFSIFHMHPRVCHQ